MDGSAYTALRRDIVSGDIPAGVHLAELVLAARYGVSRTPVREALSRLEQDGLVERIGRRLRVRQYRPEEVLDIYEVRIILEEAAARGAALRCNALDVSMLIRAHEEMMSITDEDAMCRASADRQFHERLWAASHSDTLIDLLGRLCVPLHRYPQMTSTYPGRWKEILAEHEQLLGAIRDHQPDEAARIAGQHVTASRDVRLAMYAAQVDPGH